MTAVLLTPKFEDIGGATDVLLRAAFHFFHLEGVEIFFEGPHELVTRVLDDPLPENFDITSRDRLAAMQQQFKNLQDYSEEERKSLHINAVLQWDTGHGSPPVLETFQLPNRKYQVNPKTERQEGSFYIQAAFDCCPNQDSYLKASYEAFSRVMGTVKKSPRSYIFATGPSAERYAEFEYDDSVKIVCNSIILNDELMATIKPQFVVFADPIFHFGVSTYAAEFRKKLRMTLETTNIFAVIPFKYYPLCLSLFPEFRDRIVAIPMADRLEFNHHFDQCCEVKTTSNILTLLMLPLAAYFSDDIWLLGCDGRPLDDDSYFWGHGKSVQIEHEMQAIKLVHPGFFDIDYQDYYFEHCYTLEAQIRYLEASNKRVGHLTESFIPALSMRSPAVENSISPRPILLLEPDGIGRNGHYVPWHNQLLRQLRASDDVECYIGCNRRQDGELYDTEAIPVFTSHSWDFSRSEKAFQRDFEEQERYQGFLKELKGLISTVSAKNSVSSLSVFVFYGSLQVLKMCQTLREQFARQGFSIRFSICLFHEAVLLKSGLQFPRFPPQAREIILSACARPDVYEIACVTGELSAYMSDKFRIPLLPVMPNPIPSIEVEMLPKQTAEIRKVQEGHTIFFPARDRLEKGAELSRQFFASQADVNKSLIAGNRWMVRESILRNFQPEADNIESFDDEIRDDDYATLLREADLIVLPYFAPQFSFRTSGIVVDALAAGKPFICLDGTWLASVARLTGAGLVFNASSELSLASAVTTAVKNLEQLSRRAASAYEAYEKKHSWGRLVSVMRLEGTS